MGKRKQMTKKQHIEAADYVSRMFRDSQELGTLIANNTPLNGSCDRKAQLIKKKVLNLMLMLENMARDEKVLNAGFPHFGGKDLERWKRGEI